MMAQINFHYEDDQVLAEVLNTSYAKEQLARVLHTLTCDQKWSLYRAIAKLSHVTTMECLERAEHALSEVMFRHGYLPSSVPGLAQASRDRIANELKDK